MFASGSNEKDKKVQRVVILNCAGPPVVKLAKQFTYENQEEVFAVVEDIIVYGSVTTLEDAEKDNEINLLKLREKCKEQHIKLNNDKAVDKDVTNKIYGTFNFE